METSTTPLASSTALDDSPSQTRDIPQLHRLRIAPLRNPIPHSRKAPSPLEPSAGTVRRPKYPKASLTSGNPSSTDHPALTSLLNNRTYRDRSPPIQPPSESTWNPEPPPKTVLPAFINLQAVERLPLPSFDEEVSRKRIRLETNNNENFGERLQLPIPKLQKEATKPPPFGPLTILNGLNEPPPNAAIFPPIEPNGPPPILTRPQRDHPSQLGYDTLDWKQESRGAKLNEVIGPRHETYEVGVLNDSAGHPVRNIPGGNKEFGKERVSDTLNIDEAQTSRTKSQPKKKLRKWSEQETHDLLLGVVRCGVGNWTAILGQPDLHFDNRTASNLKDRFRVCCPWAYESDQKASAEAVRARLADRVKNGQHGKIFLPDPRMTGFNEPKSITATSSINGINATSTTMPTTITPSGPSIRSSSNTAAASQSELTQRKSSTRNKNTSSSSSRTPSLPVKSKNTLISLGLLDPDKAVKATRRSRRPFTPAEDEALLKGYAVHGFQWTVIRQDKHLNLMHRKATDLRDRFRTKFPSAYREGGSATAKNITPARMNNTSDKLPKTLLEGNSASLSTSDHTRATDNTIQSRERSTMGIQRTDVASGNTGAAPIDPAMLPPAPPSNATFSFSSLIDDNTCPGAGDNSDIRWADNTLPPLIWDELG